jgi:hypothetical protein
MQTRVCASAQAMTAPVLPSLHSEINALLQLGSCKRVGESELQPRLNSCTAAATTARLLLVARSNAGDAHAVIQS